MTDITLEIIPSPQITLDVSINVVDGAVLSGANGTNGTNGTNGAPGSVWYKGAGVPSNSVGINGDFYLNSVAPNNYYAKVSGAWALQGSLQGLQGAQGQRGLQGDSLRTFLLLDTVTTPTTGDVNSFINARIKITATLTGTAGTCTAAAKFQGSLDNITWFDFADITMSNPGDGTQYIVSQIMGGLYSYCRGVLTSITGTNAAFTMSLQTGFA